MDVCFDGVTFEKSCDFTLSNLTSALEFGELHEGEEEEVESDFFF
jgi:hypothetical protein